MLTWSIMDSNPWDERLFSPIGDRERHHFHRSCSFSLVNVAVAWLSGNLASNRRATRLWRMVDEVKSLCWMLRMESVVNTLVSVYSRRAMYLIPPLPVFLDVDIVWARQTCLTTISTTPISPWRSRTNLFPLYCTEWLYSPKRAWTTLLFFESCLLSLFVVATNVRIMTDFPCLLVLQQWQKIGQRVPHSCCQSSGRG